MHVDVCICTFRRPEGLETCLRALARQRLAQPAALQGAGPHAVIAEPHAVITEPHVVGEEPSAVAGPAAVAGASRDVTTVGDVDLRIVVVDNDPGASARVTCDELAAELPWPLHYVHEPARGITHARTRAVREVRASAEWMAFLDDDEEPVDTWLASLLGVQRATGARIVAGPVVSNVVGEAPEWISHIRVFNRARHPSGTEVPMTGTGNVLLHAPMMRALREPFDHRFALSGGEDTHLFMRLRHAGERIVWSDEAVAVEHVPASRLTFGWFLRRSWRGGLTYAQSERAVHPSVHTALNRAARGCLRVVRGSVVLLTAVVRGRAVAAHGVELLVDGTGVLAGLAGWRYQEYRTTHGT